ncbi:unnamed protein product [Heligmosomoides polygyrus]|uniref:Reverse transcriptase domain-containing protein n=1 Tax=Heligmosomoides polygyrus TaxID=6339 RepID=A0A183GG75_HELPZ|nr:unnamed protein product [Heligmosomoides polygyrus]
MEVKVDGRQLYHLRHADDIVLITPSTKERMLADFDRVCEKVGLQLNLTKTMFMRNGQVSDAPFSLNGSNIPECSSCQLGPSASVEQKETSSLASFQERRRTSDSVSTNPAPMLLLVVAYASET